MEDAASPRGSGGEPAGGKEHQVTPEELQHLNALFQEYEKRGRQLLDMETFKCIMKQSMRSQKKVNGFYKCWIIETTVKTSTVGTN